MSKHHFFIVVTQSDKKIGTVHSFPARKPQNEKVIKSMTLFRKLE